MKLTKLIATNVKGQSFILNLTASNFFVGDNFAGKTARTDAIRLLLLGYLPELGKTNAATFELCSGREMSVEGETDTGLKLWRRWYVKGDSVKSQESIPDEIGKCGTLAAMLDANAYFGLSERERTAYVMANIPNMEGCTPDEFLQEIGDHLAGDEEVEEEAARAVMDDLVGAKSAEEASDSFRSWTGQTFLEWSIVEVADQTKAVRAVGVGYEQTVQKLSTLRAADQQVFNSAGAEKQMTALSAEIEKLREKRAAGAVAVNQQTTNQARRRQLEQELAGKHAIEIEYQAAQVQYGQAIADLAMVPNPAEEDMEGMRKEELEAAIIAANCGNEIESLSLAKAKMEEEQRLLDLQVACPYCGATGQGWKGVKHAELTSGIGDLIRRLAEGENRRSGAKQIADSARRVLHNLQRDKQKWLEAKQAVSNLKDRIAALAQKISSWTGREEELARLPQMSSEIVADFEAARTLLKVKEEELAKLEAMRRAQEGRQHELKRLAQAEEERDKAKAQEKAWKAVAACLRGLQAQMVADAFEPLLETANKLFSDVLLSPLAYNPVGGVIGTYRDGRWITHRTMSGTEKALVYAAIQTALAARVPFRLMILDELGRLDAQNLVKVIECLLRAVLQGHIDQFVGIHTSLKEPTADLPGGLTVLRV